MWDTRSLALAGAQIGCNTRLGRFLLKSSIEKRFKL